MSMVIQIKPRSKTLRPINVNTTPETTLQDILEQYAKVNKISPSRVKLSKIDDTGKSKKKQLTLNYKQSVSGNSLMKDEIIYAKDLGPQISWKLVFLIEYFGPILINTIFYYFIYDAGRVTLTQQISYILIMLHFFKREYETTFVHSFSHSTMPLFNLFKNCFHYWILSGLLLGITLYRDQPPRSGNVIKDFAFHVRDCPTDQIILLLIFWSIAEFANFKCHLILRDLRRDGVTGHSIPYGFLFEYVSCPNYFCESLAWLTFAILNNNWSSWVFFFVGTIQMILWAIKKHSNLKKEFPNYPKNRKIMIPYIF